MALSRLTHVRLGSSWFLKNGKRRLSEVAFLSFQIRSAFSLSFWHEQTISRIAPGENFKFKLTLSRVRDNGNHGNIRCFTILRESARECARLCDNHSHGRSITEGHEQAEVAETGESQDRDPEKE